MLKDFQDEYERYRLLGEKAISQLSDDALNRRDSPEANSVATIVRHIGGNLISRFTDFTTSDGEKSWRNRDGEFEARNYERGEMEEYWRAGWDALKTALESLSDADLGREVTIRGVPLTVHEALCRSSAHVAYHVGQIVLLARMNQRENWKWLSIPPGGSKEYNLAPTREKKPG